MTPPSRQRGMSTWPVLPRTREVDPLLLEPLGHVLVRVHDDRALLEARAPAREGPGRSPRAAHGEQDEGPGEFFHARRGYISTGQPAGGFTRLPASSPRAAPRAPRASPPRSPRGSPHPGEVEEDVVHREQHRRGEILQHEEIPQVGAAVPAADRAGAVRIERREVFLEALVLDRDLAARGVDVAHPAVARRQDAVEEVDARAHRGEQVGRRARRPSGTAASPRAGARAESSVTPRIASFDSPTATPPIA